MNTRNQNQYVSRQASPPKQTTSAVSGPSYAGNVGRSARPLPYRTVTEANAQQAAYAQEVRQATSLVRSRAEPAQEFALTALDAFESPIYIVDPAARLVLANRTGEQHLTLGTPFLLADQALYLSDSESRPLLEMVLSAAFSQRALSVTRRIGRWFIRVVALSSQAATAMIYVVPDDPQPLSRDTLREMLGFSRAESDVAYMLADGWTAKEIAFSRSVSVHTIRSQVRQILHKAGVRRHADLAKILFSLPHMNGSVAG